MATILIAEDSPTEAALMARVVQELGHVAQTVGDGEACIEKARALSPELIVMDVIMPKVDGFNACRQIREDAKLSKTPVIIVTSKNQETDRFWAESQGASQYITKPFSPDALARAIKTFLP